MSKRLKSLLVYYINRPGNFKQMSEQDSQAFDPHRVSHFDRANKPRPECKRGVVYPRSPRQKKPQLAQKCGVCSGYLMCFDDTDEYTGPDESITGWICHKSCLLSAGLLTPQPQIPQPNPPNLDLPPK